MTGRRKRRARRKVLAGIAFAVLFHLGLNVALDTAKPQWRDPEYGHRLKELKPLARAAGEKPVVVALGSSRSQMGFSPEHMGLDDSAVVYNFSQAGCGPLHQLLNLKRLLAAGVKPNFLLVEILPPVLGGEARAEWLLIPPRLSADDLAVARPYCENFSELETKWYKSRVSPWHTYRINLMSHISPGSLPWQARQDFLWVQMKPHGWMPYFFAQIPDEKRADGIAKANAQYIPYFIDFHLAPLPERAYRDLIEVCRMEGILLAFYTMPESPTFREWYTPKAKLVLADYYQSLRAAGFPVFDASTWFDDEHQFADGHHLMRPGAEALSERFGRECLGPWLGSKPAVR